MGSSTDRFRTASYPCLPKAAIFSQGTFLWTEGLDEWKSADAIFGLAEAEDGEAIAGEPSLG